MKKHTITIIETDSHVEMKLSFNLNVLLELGDNRSVSDEIALAAVDGALDMMDFYDDQDDDEEEASIH